MGNSVVGMNSEILITMNYQKSEAMYEYYHRSLTTLKTSEAYW